MKKKLLLAAAVNLCLSTIAFSGAGEGATNGGDICENKISSIILDIESWIQNGGSKNLTFEIDLDQESYNQKMLEAINSKPTVKCQKDILSLGSAEKTCLNTIVGEKTEILCNLDRINDLSIEDQYKIIHHEVAGLAGIEVSEGEQSEYFYSNQVTSSLEVQMVKKLAIKKSAILDIDMANIPAGEFIMGESKNRYHSPGEYEHKVTLTKDFLIMKDEVTQELWFEVTGKNPSFHKTKENCPETYIVKESKEFGFEELCPTHPVESVTKAQIKEFIEKLNKMTGEKYRLPTEAEWEYAARGGRQTEYFFGDREDFLNQFVINKFNSNNQTHVVGSKRDKINTPNQYGLYDMAGNVVEIVEDNYSWLTEDSQIDPLFVEDLGDIVGRGGSYQSDAYRLRSAHRMNWYRNNKYLDTGFRLAK